MAFAHEIKLPRDPKPLWPERCVCCFAEAPEHRVLFWTFSIGWHTVIFWTPGTLHTVRVPVCHECRTSFQVKRVLRVAVSITLCVIAAYLALKVLGSYRGAFRKPLAMIIAIGGLLPWFFWETIVPPAFGMTSYRKSVVYEFRDPRFAAAFHRANHSAAD